mgnify:FL=1
MPNREKDKKGPDAYPGPRKDNPANPGKHHGDQPGQKKPGSGYGSPSGGPKHTGYEPGKGNR